MKKLTYLLAFNFVFFFIFALTSNAFAASLDVSPTSGSYVVDNTFTIKININTDAVKISGSDAKLSFDPSFLSVQNIDTTGGVFGTGYPARSFDNATGKIKISGTADPITGYTGSGLMAQVNFKALKSGTASLTINPASSSDPSKIINYETGSNILSSVTNGSYTLSGSAGGSSSSPPPSTTPPPTGGSTTSTTPTTPITQTPTVTQTSTLPQAGNIETTIFLVLFGFLFLTVGVFRLSRN